MPMRNDFRKKRSIALVLSGGGIKAAAFHIGVCLGLQEKGFHFSGGTKDQYRLSYPEDDRPTIRTYVGSSAGAFISSVLASGHRIEDLVNAFDVGLKRTPHFVDRRDSVLRSISYRDLFVLNGKSFLFSFPRALINRSVFKGGIESLIKSKFKINGLFSTKGVARYLLDSALVTNSFHELGPKLFIVGTQLNHSRKVIFGAFPESSKTDRLKFVSYASISDAVAASVALPPVYSPYGIPSPKGYDIYYFDGEIRDTLSTHIAADHGADLVISSYSVQPYHFNNQVGSLSDFGIPAIINQALYQLIQQKIDRHITNQNEVTKVYTEIDRYCKNQGLTDAHRNNLLEMVVKSFNFKPNVDYLYIHPKAQDHEMFFADHFSLNPDILEKIVKVGFKAALNALRKIQI